MYRRWVWLQFPQLALANAQHVMEQVLSSQGEVARARMGLQPPRSFAAKRTTRRVHPPIVPMPAAAPWPPASSTPLLALPSEARTKPIVQPPSKRSASRTGTRLATRGTIRGHMRSFVSKDGAAGHRASVSPGSTTMKSRNARSPGTPLYPVMSAEGQFASMRSILDPHAERDKAARDKAALATDEQLLGPEQPLYAAAS